MCLPAIADGLDMLHQTILCPHCARTPRNSDWIQEHTWFHFWSLCTCFTVLQKYLWYGYHCLLHPNYLSEAAKALIISYKQSNVKTKRNMRMHPESYFLNTYWIYQWQLQWFYKTVIQTKNKYRKIMFVTKITLRRKKLLKKMLIFAQFLQMLNIDFSEWMIRIC